MSGCLFVEEERGENPIAKEWTKTSFIERHKEYHTVKNTKVRKTTRVLFHILYFDTLKELKCLFYSFLYIIKAKINQEISPLKINFPVFYLFGVRFRSTFSALFRIKEKIKV